MFYDKFVTLCTQKGIAPSRAAEEAGFSKSLVSKWKSNDADTPSTEVLVKISDYFGVSVAYLLGEEEKEFSSRMEVLTESEIEMIEMFRKVPKDHQAIVIQMIRAALGAQ